MSDVLFVLEKLSFEAMIAEERASRVFTGTREECEQFALQGGYEWKPSSRYWVGGFWYKRAHSVAEESAYMEMKKIA